IENTSELSAEFRAIAEDSGQLQAVYFVTASSAAGADPYYTGARTPSLIVGSPTHLPFHESFSGMTASATWHLQMPENSEGRWELTAVDPGPHDADGGYAEFTPVIEGDGFSLLSEKITLDVDLPLLSFFYYAVPADDHLNLSVIPLDGSQPILASFPLSSGTGWTEADIDLRPLAGKTVQILFSYSTAAGAHVLLDNISVTSGLLRNLTALSISAPEKMEVGTPYPVEVTVRNAGMEPVDSYNVHLYRDDDLVASVTAPSIQPFATAAVTFTQTPTLFFPDQTAYHAVIEADNEQDTSDNTISPVISAISFPACPAVSDLEASADGDAGVTLSWTPVNPADVQPVTLTEYFESYESFTISDLSPWTLVDRDARGTWGIGIDNMPHAGDPMAYILIDNTNFPDDPNFSSRLSGNKYLASISSTAEHNDDWLISPL
ncbi:MAG: hypothetical protein K2K36_04975, partial [Muribaculaceae bacterium]|nr:hypothetical protein [Muribaculaceae bacterium]